MVTELWLNPFRENVRSHRVTGKCDTQLAVDVSGVAKLGYNCEESLDEI